MESGYNEFNDSTLNLEAKLSRMLKPVRPNPVFLKTLKTKLSHRSSIILESSKKKVSILVIGAGLFAGALAVWLIGRISKPKD
jgi:hypothetical protein